jgi:hypothetical protein
VFLLTVWQMARLIPSCWEYLRLESQMGMQILNLMVTLMEKTRANPMPYDSVNLTAFVTDSQILNPRVWPMASRWRYLPERL